MGFLDLFRPSDDVEYSRFQPRVTEFGSFDHMVSDFLGNWDGNGLVEVGQDGSGYITSAYRDVLNMSPARMWNEQVQFRTVIDFIARNFAQLGIHTFERVDENDRRRHRDNPFALSIKAPDTDITEYDAKYALAVDYMLYDVAYWWVTPNRADIPGAYRFRRIPPAWIEPHEKDPWTRDYYVVDNGQGGKRKIPAEEVLCFRGFSPSRPGEGSPRILALRQQLAEQLYAWEHRNKVWRNGARASAYISRPTDAGKWSSESRTRFKEDWQNIKAGGVGVLEDGMKLERTDFSARENDFVAASRLTNAQVAAAFHVNPTMVGQTENASYSNVREFRRMLYGDTLGPLLAQMEDRFNAILLPMLGMDNDKFYVEFNINEKMQGNFEDQVIALQSATGGPYMTRNEARKTLNLPALPSADELIVPLNVIEGGQASPRDSGSQNDKPGGNVNPENEFN